MRFNLIHADRLYHRTVITCNGLGRSYRMIRKESVGNKFRSYWGNIVNVVEVSLTEKG